MAGANYEVNLQLKADPAVKALERIEKKINTLTKSSVDLQDARGAAMVKNRNLADKINKLEEKGVDVAKMRERLGRAIEKTDKSKLQTAAAHRGIVKELIKDENKLLDVKQNQLKVDRQQQRQRAGAGAPGRFGQAVLGGGFPLLFGGSPFQALGGAVGGAFGGFAGGIGAQVAVGQIENLFAKAAELGQSLGKLNFNLQGVTEAAGFAGTETAQFLERIEQYGDAALAAELATKLLEKRIGVEGVQALKDFGEKANELGRGLSTIFTQVLAGIAQAAGPLISFLAKFAGEQAAVGGFKERTDLIVGSREEFAQQVLTGDIGGKGKGGKRARLLARAKELGIDATTERQVREFARQTAIESQRAFELPTIKEIEFEASLVKDPADEKGVKTAQRLLEASQRRIKILELETREIKEITSLKDKIAAAELAGDKRSVARLRRDQALARLKSDEEQAIARINTKLSEQQQNLERQSIEAKGVAQAAEIHAEFQRDIAEIIADTNEKFEDQMAHQEELRQKINEQESAYTALNDTFRTGIVDAILTAVEGSESLRDSLLGVIQSMARLILQQQLLNALEGVNLFSPAPSTSTAGPGGYTVPSDAIPNFFLGKALGGSVSANKPYMVGERGPELFVPGAQGNVVPNNAIGGANVVVNVDASGSQAQGNQPNAKALGAAIGAAVQAELVKQKRPGGLLS